MRKLGLALLAAATPAWACINDSDTLAFELRNVDALNRIERETDHRTKNAAIHELALRAIGGRFERFPARYYEMRIERLKAKPKLEGMDWDDLAVAYDRLGQVDKAIETILVSKPHRKTEEERYRFHANYGTFLVHRWFVDGHRKEDFRTLDQSIEEIEKAVAINPGSHFGREHIQLALQRSWRDGKKPGDELFDIEKLEMEARIVGLSGIVMMGLGYELPDVYRLMAQSDLLGNATGDTMFNDLANLRADQLVKQGKPELLKVRPYYPSVEDDERRAFAELLKDGEAVHRERTAYMNARFDRGEHPDTHPAFWSDWKEPKFPVLKVVPDPMVAAGRMVPPILVGVAAFSIIAAISVTIWVRRSRVR